MKAYGIGSHNGAFPCGCCGGKYMKVFGNKGKSTSKQVCKSAKKVARREAKKELQVELVKL